MNNQKWSLLHHEDAYQKSKKSKKKKKIANWCWKDQKTAMGLSIAVRCLVLVNMVKKTSRLPSSFFLLGSNFWDLLIIMGFNLVYIGRYTRTQTFKRVICFTCPKKVYMVFCMLLLWLLCVYMWMIAIKSPSIWLWKW